jgi:hypothetical protein
MYTRPFNALSDIAALSAFSLFTQRPLLSLIGDRAFLAVGDDAWAASARSFPGVLTVQQRPPHGKISPQLKAALDSPSLSPLRIISHCFPGPGCFSSRSIAESVPSCEVYAHYDSIEMLCSAANARAAAGMLADSPGVHWVELKRALKPRNFAGSCIISMGGSCTSATSSNVLSSIALDPATSIIAVAGSLAHNAAADCPPAASPLPLPPPSSSHFPYRHRARPQQLLFLHNCIAVQK